MASIGLLKLKMILRPRTWCNHLPTNTFFEQDEEQLVEDGLDTEGTFATITTIEEFGPEHDSWKFYQDPTQEEFYIKVNV